jgi:hypothetical protein
MAPLPAARGVPAVLSRTVARGPVADWMAATEAPRVVAGVALAKVMLPVWVGPQKVMVPAAVVKIWASSALLTFRPAAGAAPALMGSSGWAVRTTTPPAPGPGVNTLTLLLPKLATKRLPAASKATALGASSPVRVAVRLVAPGANSLTAVPFLLATNRSPWAWKATATGTFSPVRVAVGVVPTMRWVPTRAGSAPVAMSTALPRRVMASLSALSDTTVAPLPIDKTPPPLLGVPLVLTPAGTRPGSLSGARWRRRRQEGRIPARWPGGRIWFRSRRGTCHSC